MIRMTPLIESLIRVARSGKVCAIILRPDLFDRLPRLPGHVVYIEGVPIRRRAY